MNSSTPSIPRNGSAVTLRLARADDVRQLASIERGAFSDPWPESAFAELLEREHVRMTVAISGETVVGYCVLLHVADEAEIANIAVTPECRRQGVAARLLDNAIESARAGRALAIYLEVRTSNQPARELYASRGFRPVGRRRGYYQHPVEDALVLRWSAPLFD